MLLYAMAVSRENRSPIQKSRENYWVVEQSLSENWTGDPFDRIMVIFGARCQAKRQKRYSLSGSRCGVYNRDNENLNTLQVAVIFLDSASGGQEPF